MKSNATFPFHTIVLHFSKFDITIIMFSFPLKVNFLSFTRKQQFWQFGIISIKFL
jgi:hypothetical protein